jgi:bifunctional N-acetylglucosamine-1-phosphate-uridyltransferase/glucosamine-1-phosphate-acetyltransferase GlmU-like protein
MSDLTLVVLAAGMGSRYGSLKQMDGVGPNNEAIIDYSIFDAIRAGFTKVVFVIRHSFEKEFREVFTPERFGGIEVEFVFQELDYLPDGYTVPEGREKPWGTNHAVMMAKSAVTGPFAVINADDFYGKDSYKVLADYMKTLQGHENRYAMVGFQISNTISENGTVSRGICSEDADGNLTGMIERHGIERRKKDGQIIFVDEQGVEQPLGDRTPVSMNMFGFTPDYFQHSEEFFKTFLSANISNLKAEFYIPLMVDTLIQNGTATMRVLPTDSVWFGVTYKADKPMVQERIRQLIKEGVYPEKLWK